MDVYYADKGTDNWYQAAFSIVDYGTRAVPNTLLPAGAHQHRAVELLALEGHGVRHPLRSRSRPSWTRPSAADLYKQAQQILQDQVPMMNFLVNTAVAGQNANDRRRLPGAGLRAVALPRRALHGVTDASQRSPPA